MNRKALVIVAVALVAAAAVAVSAETEAETNPPTQQPPQPGARPLPPSASPHPPQQSQQRGPPPLPKPAVVAGPRKFTCVFFPGVGIDWPALDVDEPKRASHPKFLRREYPAYWGDQLKGKLAGKCEELWFYDTDTHYRPWNDPSLVREFSRVIAEQKPHVVFAHGMGNLVLAQCKRDRLEGCKDLGKKVDWFAIQPMLRGTDVPEVMEQLCPKLVADESFKGGVDCVPKQPLSSQPPSQQQYDVADAWKALVPGRVPRWVYKMAENDLSGEVCGLAAADYTQPSDKADANGFGLLAKAMSTHTQKGLTSRNGRYRPDPDDWKTRNLVTARQTPKFGNDGVVAFSSCAVRATTKFKKNAQHKWYALDGDHDFGTCSSGDTQYDSQRPCAWIVNMVDRVRKQNKFPPRFVQLHADADADADADVDAADAEEEEEEEEDEQDAEDEDGVADADESEADDAQEVDAADEQSEEDEADDAADDEAEVDA